MRRHKLLIVFVILGFSIGLFSLSPKALTVSGTARNMIVQIIDSKGNILDGVHSAIGGISFPNEIVQVMNSTGQILDSLGGGGTANYTFSGTAGAVYFAGAMDNNVTATLTDTTNNPFTGTNVGNLICVDGAGSAGVDACGTISSVTDSGHAVLSFNNTSGGAISGKMYAFGADNSAALTAMNTAMANQPQRAGLNVLIPAGYYAVGSSGHIIIPPDRTIVLNGAGTGVIVDPAGSANGNVNTSGMPVTMFMTLTHGMTGAFMQLVNTANHGTYNAQYQFNNFTLMGGVGFTPHSDGACATCDGVDIINWTNIDFNNVGISEFGAAGLFIDVAATSPIVSNNSGSINMHRLYTYTNGTSGVRIGGTALGTGNLDAFQIQNIVMDYNSAVFNNGFNGFSVISNIKDLTIRDSLFQGNRVLAGGAAELGLQAQIQGGVVESNYFECDHTGTNGIIYNAFSPIPALMPGALDIIGNQIISVGGACGNHVLIGNDATHVTGGVTLASNYFDGGAVGACVSAFVDTSVRGGANWCNPSGAWVTFPPPLSLSTSSVACTALNEGQLNVQTNSTAACSAGTTATTAGTTHCQVYCNGANWIQTGR